MQALALDPALALALTRRCSQALGRVVTLLPQPVNAADTQAALIEQQESQRRFRR